LTLESDNTNNKTAVPKWNWQVCQPQEELAFNVAIGGGAGAKIIRAYGGWSKTEAVASANVETPNFPRTNACEATEPPNFFVF
jgi:hypothetical protein